VGRDFSGGAEGKIILAEMDAVGFDGEGGIEMIIEHEEGAIPVGEQSGFFGEGEICMGGEFFFPELDEGDSRIEGGVKDVEGGPPGGNRSGGHQVEPGGIELGEAFAVRFGHAGTVR
jgi:hypothetical protein